MPEQRVAGVLLHLTSLPGPGGIGGLGPAAHQFLDQLAAMEQSCWQMLPTGPTGYGDSPYQTLSSFAGNELLLSLEDLKTCGLLNPDAFHQLPSFPTGDVDYGEAIPLRRSLYRRVYLHFVSTRPSDFAERFAAFCENEKGWLDDYALFRALKDHFQGRPWTQWPQPVATRNREALEVARREFHEAIEFYSLLQFLFRQQWDALREAAKAKGIALVGDIPIFVAHDSADVWAATELFDLEPSGKQRVVAGVPPDYFSEDGQLWGNPLYRWDRHEAEGYQWWIHRLQAAFQCFDIVRIDHFRGFEAYWEIPADAQTAKGGRWAPGPGASLFQAAREALGPLPIIAEDLGYITPEVHALRDELGFPGMRILQFSFGDPNAPVGTFPPDYPANCAAYTGTHDNETLQAWIHRKPLEGNTLSADQIAGELSLARRLAGSTNGDLHWDLIRLILDSPARLAVIPMQDLLELDATARMNTPGRPDGNWQWRWDGKVPEHVRDRLARLAASSGRARL